MYRLRTGRHCEVSTAPVAWVSLDSRHLLAIFALLTACARTGGGGPPDSGEQGHAQLEPEPKPDPEPPGDSCDPASLGLGGAKPVTYAPPPGCRTQVETDAPINDEATFHAAFACSAASGIDFSQSELHVVMRTLSPASVGVDVVDDGTTLTFVSRQRNPCPSEYPPMPIEVAVAYVTPIAAERAIGQAMCSVTVPCK